MADKAELKAEIRESVGTTSAAKLRKTGKCPAIVYGHGEEPVSIGISLRDFVVGLHHGQRLFNIEIAGKAETLLVKDIQYDHFGSEIIHADFVRVNLAEVVQVSVDIVLKGIAAGTHEGGIIDVHQAQLAIECKVSAIPGSLEFPIKGIQVGDTVHAGEITLPDGVKLITDPDAVVLTCHLVVEAQSTDELEEDMPSSPEVITEKNVEEGAE